ncbi:uncharacterized protein LOC126558434 [Anopheles maculipalpis]|uniref:uncharacterized protein LOC126558434 n=1 Tax=Anopheles maculipalpis TaxID=1496333 RepID=UPI002159AE7C|nr:uncharacterized protein LOC126558434 [Anopheles maculipalpis]
MDPGTFAQDFYCRLCAAEGVVIHPLFPPGDNDPKDELVRMIEVLTSVHLAQADDAGAVICDKCLQMLDLFCKFREECLRQDVLIRTRRTLLAGQLVRQRHPQQALFEQQDLAVQSPPAVEVKMEEALPVIEDKQEEVICIQAQQLENTGNIKQESELDEPEQVQQLLVASYPVPLELESPTLLQSPDLSHDTIINSSLNDAFCPLSSSALILSTDSVTISLPDTDKISSNAARRIKTKNRTTNHKESAAGSERSQESCVPHNEYDQQLQRQQHSWDKANRCSLACDPCQMRFTKSYNLKRHMYEVHGEVPQGLTVIPCVHCGERFLRGNILERHIAKVHQNKSKLKICAIQFT